ncbi:CLUMA_CG003549, isoform A [Clunio marinus]|uniref:CLUMA_CG003549, isoform A n=1 Tax=Clunio marinus TaxID=568069 RepID=A0A1J1HQR3_9DIPT|nr:CLUMA_CG003549, isoform A [Clunio marinus]
MKTTVHCDYMMNLRKNHRSTNEIPSSFIFSSISELFFGGRHAANDIFYLLLLCFYAFHSNSSPIMHKHKYSLHQTELESVDLELNSTRYRSRIINIKITQELCDGLKSSDFLVEEKYKIKEKEDKKRPQEKKFVEEAYEER